MRKGTPLLAVFVAFASSGAVAQTVNTTVLTAVVQALESLGLTSLATVAASVNSTTAGEALLAQLSQGVALTVFAPSNDAC